jgi:uncharacterized protein (UPF0264 family)
LLVSVRTAVEAQAAVAGGAAIVDIKEPAHGPLGRAPASVWSAVRAVVAPPTSVSVALGELAEWSGVNRAQFPASAWSGISFCKLGLSHAPLDWRDRWRDLRRELRGLAGPNLAWVAVVYTDWESAGAPDPEAVIGALTDVHECRGVLFDTWDKASATRVDSTWSQRLSRIRDSGRLVALAGGIDLAAIGRLASLDFDIIAVRGAACADGNRCAMIDARRVAALAQATARAGVQELLAGLGCVDSSSTLSGAGKNSSHADR